MKISLTLLCILTFYLNGALGQFNFTHTNGPNGGGFGRLISENTFLYYSGEHFVYRSTDGNDWTRLVTKKLIFIDAHKNDVVGIEMPTILNGGFDLKVAISKNSGEYFESVPIPEKIKSIFYEGYNIKTHKGIIYIPFVDYSVNRSFIYKSNDYGLSWTLLSLPFNHTYFPHRSFFKDTISSLGFHDNTFGIWQSFDQGETWNVINISPILNDYVEEFYIHDNHILLATNNALIVSHDGGQVWQKTVIFDPIKQLYRFRDFMLNNEILYALKPITSYKQNIVFSKDYGDSWDVLPEHLYNTEIQKLIGRDSFLFIQDKTNGIFQYDLATSSYNFPLNEPASGVIYDLKIDQQNNILASVGSKVYLLDIDEQWHHITEIPIANRKIEFIGTNTKNEIFLGGSNLYSILKSNDQGLNWDTITFEKLYDYRYDDMEIFGDAIILYRRLSNIRISKDDGLTWDEFQFEPKDIICYKDNYIAVSQNRIYRSFNGLDSFDLISEQEYKFSGITSTSDYLFAYFEKEIDDFDSIFLYRSTDGINWEYAHSGLTSTWVVPFTSFKPNIIEYNGTYILNSNYSGIYISQDYGITWKKVLDEKFNHWLLRDETLYVTINNHFGGGLLSINIDTFLDYFVTSINPIDKNNTVTTRSRIYPNPGFDPLYIKSNSTIISVDIYNGVGIKVYGEKFNNAYCKLNIPQIRSGLFFVKINYDDGKFEVQKYLHQK